MQFLNDLINVNSYGKVRVFFNEERGPVSFFCKDCNKIVETEQKSHKKKKKYTFICTTCKSENVAIGTEEGLIEHYKLGEKNKK